MLEELLSFVPAYVLAFFRVAALMLFAPLLGSGMIPRRVKVLLAMAITVGIVPGIAAIELPQSEWQLALVIGAEMAFGLAMGMVVSFVFVAAQWAGELMGQQMGLNLSEVFDPQFGAQGSLVGSMYYMLCLVIFISPAVRGDHALLRGLRASFDTLPLMSITMSSDLLGMIVRLVQAASILALQLAAPMLVTMMIVDVAMGFVGKTMPQLNIMSAGLSIRALVGMLILIVGLLLTSHVISRAMVDFGQTAESAWLGAWR
jgi:flagellar biosynthetic protein FliR